MTQQAVSKSSSQFAGFFDQKEKKDETISKQQQVQSEQFVKELHSQRPLSSKNMRFKDNQQSSDKYSDKYVDRQLDPVQNFDSTHNLKALKQLKSSSKSNPQQQLLLTSIQKQRKQQDLQVPINENCKQLLQYVPFATTESKKRELDNYVTRVEQNFLYSKSTTTNPAAATNGSKLSIHPVSPKQFTVARSISPPNKANQQQYYISNALGAWKEPFKLAILSIQLYKEHINQTYVGIQFSLKLQPVNKEQIQQKQVNLRQYPSKLKFQKTVIFDLDETLVHCQENNQLHSDTTLKIQFPTGNIIQAGINIRPFAFNILEELSKVCEVIIFTASHQCYASKVIEYLDPRQQYVTASLYRQNCIISPEGVHIKDIRVVGRDIKDMVIVDNAAYSFAYQISNGIPIVPFYDNKSDLELKSLLHFLLNEVLPQNDVRPALKKYFALQEWVNFQNGKEAVLKLYNDQN